MDLLRFFRRGKTLLAEPDAPLSPLERSRLAHRKRAAERELRALEKTLKRVGCSTCVQQTPSRGAIQMEQAATRLRREISTLEARLDTS